MYKTQITLYKTQFVEECFSVNRIKRLTEIHKASVEALFLNFNVFVYYSRKRENMIRRLSAFAKAKLVRRIWTVNLPESDYSLQDNRWEQCTKAATDGYRSVIVWILLVTLLMERCCDTLVPWIWTFVKTPVALLSPNVGCIVGVIVVQYLFLSAMCWMLCTAWTLYSKVIIVINDGGQGREFWSYC